MNNDTQHDEQAARAAAHALTQALWHMNRDAAKADRKARRGTIRAAKANANRTGGPTNRKLSYHELRAAETGHWGHAA